MIDDMWEQRVLPTLSEYTRIPCLSPAFDPDWAERGAMLEAAELLRTWAQDQDAGLTTEIVQLPGRTPVLLVENGGSRRPDLDLRPHGQAAAAGRVAARPLPLRAGTRGRPPLRPRHRPTTATPSSPP